MPVGRDLDARLQADGLVGVAVVVDGALGLVDAAPAAPRARRACAARCTRAAPSIVARIVSRPCRSTSAVTRRTPVALAAIWARKSPAVSCFERIWARISLKTSSHDRAALDEPDRRDDHALLEDLAERADRRRRAAADVDVVREVGDVAEQLALVVHGRDQADVVEVDAARMRVVGDDHVAGAEVAGAVGLHRLRHLLHHRAEVHRLREPLRDRPQLARRRTRTRSPSAS